jgi:opacity protein-like surface antigen
MRRLLVALGLTGMIFDAAAADLPTLPGSQVAGPVYPHWGGFYIGGQVGYGHSHTDLPTFGARDVNAVNYGGFIGYNNPWSEVVLGVEANYNHTDLKASATDVTGASGLTLRITDYGTVRLRAGFLFERLLPYAMIGVAAGYARVDSFETVLGTAIESSFGQIIWGYSAGGGVDIAVSPRVFVRAEYEFVQLTSLSGFAPSLNAIRFAAAFRF